MIRTLFLIAAFLYAPAFADSSTLGASASSGGGTGNILDINTDATASQTLTVGSSGTDFAIADDAAGGHAFNLPSASATARGLVKASGAQTLNPDFTLSGASPIVSALTASRLVATDASKQLASLTYASANTASAMVQRDGSGNFSAGAITANLTGAVTGNASTATALAANPADCGASQYATTIAANGDLTCAAIPDAAADGTTKGIAAFTAADFDAASGVLSLDYANGQAATTGVRGFMGITAQSFAGAKYFRDGVVINTGTQALPALYGVTATSSGMWITGSNVCFSQAGLNAGCTGSNGWSMGLPSGAAQYQFSWNNSAFVEYGTINTVVKHQVRMGTTTEANTPLYANMNGGPVYKSVTNTGNVGAGEDDLQSKVLPAKFMYYNSTAADMTGAIKVRMFGTFAANGNTKRVRVYMASTVIGDCGDTTQSGGLWEINVHYNEDGSDSAHKFRSTCVMGASGGTATTVLFGSTDALDFSTSKTVKGTAQSTGSPADNDIVSEFFGVYSEPQGN